MIIAYWDNYFHIFDAKDIRSGRKIAQIVFPVDFSYGTVYNNFGMSKPADVILLKNEQFLCVKACDI